MESEFLRRREERRQELERRRIQAAAAERESSSYQRDDDLVSPNDDAAAAAGSSTETERELEQALADWKKQLHDLALAPPNVVDVSTTSDSSCTADKDSAVNTTSGGAHHGVEDAKRRLRLDLDELQQDLYRLRQRIVATVEQSDPSSSVVAARAVSLHDQWHAKLVDCQNQWGTTKQRLLPKGKFVFRRYRQAVKQQREEEVANAANSHTTNINNSNHPTTSTTREASTTPPPPSTESGSSGTAATSMTHTQPLSNNPVKTPAPGPSYDPERGRIQGYAHAHICIRADGLVQIQPLARIVDNANEQEASSSLSSVVQTFRGRHAVTTLVSLENCHVQFVPVPSFAGPQSTPADGAQPVEDGTPPTAQQDDTPKDPATAARGHSSLSSEPNAATTSWEQLHVRDTRGTTVEWTGIPPRAGGDPQGDGTNTTVVVLHVTNCHNCHFRPTISDPTNRGDKNNKGGPAAAAALILQQIRLHESTRLRLDYGRITAGAILEGCREIVFGHDGNLADADAIKQIRDFDWLKPRVPSPNFAVVVSSGSADMIATTGCNNLRSAGQAPIRPPAPSPRPNNPNPVDKQERLPEIEHKAQMRGTIEDDDEDEL